MGKVEEIKKIEMARRTLESTEKIPQTFAHLRNVQRTSWQKYSWKRRNDAAAFTFGRNKMREVT